MHAVCMQLQLQQQAQQQAASLPTANGTNTNTSTPGTGQALLNGGSAKTAATAASGAAANGTIGSHVSAGPAVVTMLNGLALGADVALWSGMPGALRRSQSDRVWRGSQQHSSADLPELRYIETFHSRGTLKLFTLRTMDLLRCIGPSTV